MVKVFDNGGATFDRYTIVTKDALYTMSSNPSSPSGFNQFGMSFGDGEEYVQKNNEREVPLDMVPVVILIAIINRLEADQYGKLTINTDQNVSART